MESSVNSPNSPLRVGIDATAVPPRPAGAGTYTLQLIRALARSALPAEFFVFADAHGQQLLDLPGEPSRPGSSPVHTILTPTQPPFRRVLWEQLRLPGLARQYRLDVLHSPHYTRPYQLPCASVVTFHDMSFFLYPEMHTRARRWFFPLAIRLSARRADALIAVSESTRRDALRLLKLASDKITAIPHGIGEEFRPLATEAGWEELRARLHRKYQLPEAFILYVGTIEPRKNLGVLFNAFANLLQSGLDLHLVLVGQLGWMYQETLAQIQHLGIGRRLRQLGYLPPEDLPAIYNLARIFVYPSIYEGFGLPPLEAMACGTPVITTRTSAMQDLVGEAAWLVAPDDERALTEAIRQMWTDPALRQEYSLRGRRQAAPFTWERTALATWQVYQTAGMRHKAARQMVAPIEVRQ